jgi:hypothetical protein
MLNIQARQRYAESMVKLLNGDQLGQRAQELGVDIAGEPRMQSSSGRAPRAPDFELQRRVTEAERAIRESRLWVLAVISAIASVLSAIVALIAVAGKR